MSLASPSSYTNEDANPFSGGISLASVTRERQERNVRKRRICLVWGCLILAILLVVLSVTGALVLRYTLGNYSDEYQMFPGDSRIAHVPSDFCEELLTTVSGPGELQLEVTQVESTPPLTRVNGTVTLNSSFEVSSSETFVLHLLHNTTVTLTNQTTESVWTFVLFGDQSYHEWLTSECKETCFADNAYYTTGSADSGNYSFNITQELNVYLVFWLEGDTSSVPVQLEAELCLTEYQTNSSSSLPSCSIASSEQSKQCSLPVPFVSNSASSLFLVKASQTSYTFKQTESVTLTCKQRVWIYFVFVAPAIVMLLTSLCILITHCCCLIREKRRTTSSLPELLANDNDADWLNEL